MTNNNLSTASRKAIILAAIGILLMTLVTIAFTVHPRAALAAEKPSTQSLIVSSDAVGPTTHIDSYTTEESHLIACEEEDSHNCFWDASTSGNGEGDSFIDWNGHVYYIDPAMDYCTDEVPSPCTPDSNN